MKNKIYKILCCLVITASIGFATIPQSISVDKTGDITKVENKVIPGSLDNCRNNYDENECNTQQKPQLSFAVFTDTHVGARYQNPLFGTADYLDRLGEDLVESTNLLDFAVHLGDIVHHNTAQVNGIGLPWFVNQYKNNVKAYFISHIHLPLYCVLGNHDLNDYQMNRKNPHNLTTALLDELSMNNPVFAMMRNGILFLSVPELGCITWTHPVEYEWIEYITAQYPNVTTIILSHQAIEDTTQSVSDEPYRGKQDMDWWATLFQQNPQIKMWIHGHNHYLDWYVSNQSTGRNYTIRSFGHDLAFSAPYSQMDWGFCHEEDRLVIYNISATGIVTATWEDNGAGGHWVSDYVHSWNIPTSFDSNTQDWYSFPMFLQDNETQLTDMKVLSPNITLQLVGTVPMELFFDARMESPSGWANETILGFGNDRSGNVKWTNPGMSVSGPTNLIFPEKYPLSTALQEDGRSGQPYHSFPMGTICAAVPGQTYNFTITARCLSGDGNLTLNVSCSDWATRSQYSMLLGSEHQVISHRFGQYNETISGSYTVPDTVDAWFLQGTLNFLDSKTYDVFLFSVKRERTSDTTDDFHIYLSGHWYNVSGSLAKNELVEFPVDPQDLCDSEGVMNFTALIKGNRYGMVNLVYHEPMLFGTNARFRIDNQQVDVYNLSLTKTITQTDALEMTLWNSKIFQKHPRIIELCYRCLMKGVTGYVVGLILDTILCTLPATFHLVPFSTSLLYEDIGIRADDGSGVKHKSGNGNIWLTCNAPIGENRLIEVTLAKH